MTTPLPLTERPAATAEELRLSPEVAHFLSSRGIAFPTCPPRITTPDPGDSPGAIFDSARVDAVLKVFHLLRHTQGRWAGKPLDPDPWQVAYIIAPVFGWVRWEDDADRYVRIIRNLYVDVPRKNGKSTLGGGLAVYLACADGESGAQVVTAATSTAQASYVFAPIKTLASTSPALAPHVQTRQGRIIHPASGSYITVVSSVAETQHGGNIHGAIVDELHVHKTPDMVETIESGTGARDQPLVVIITTADAGKPGTIYDRRRRYVESLASHTITDPTQYGVVWAVAEDADPHSPATWAAANPGYGTSPTRSYMQGKSDKAKQSPAELSAFLRLHLGRRTKQETRYLDPVSFRLGGAPADRDALRGRLAYGGLDLASVSDLCALAWLMPDDALGGFDVAFRLWTPQDNLKALDRRTAGEASVWVRTGQLTLTPGNVVDYHQVALDITADLSHYQVASIGFDPWNSSALVTSLMEEGATMVPVRQGYGSLSAPLKELQRLTLAQSATAPLLRGVDLPSILWQVDNLAVAMDPAGNVRPDKARGSDKIDAVSALTTAMAEAMTRQGPTVSVYETRGLTTA